MVFLLLFLALCLALCAGLLVFVLGQREIRVILHFLLARRFPRLFAPDVVVVGDSLALACPWEQLARRPFGVLNLARGGATLKEIGGQILLARQIACAVLLIDGGLNDLLFDRASTERLDEDFRALVRRIDPDKRAIFSLMPYVSDAHDAPIIAGGNQTIARICAETQIGVVDINPQIARDGVRRPEMTNDGLHYTRAAENIWLDAVKTALRSDG